MKTEVSVGETDLCIMGRRDLSGEAVEAINKYRGEIEDYIKLHPAFRDSLEPVEENFGVHYAEPLMADSRHWHSL